MYREVFKKYISVIIVVLLGVFCLLIIKPYIISIVSAMIIVYVFYPIYKIIEKRIKHRIISSVIMCSMVILIIILPVLSIMNSLLGEAPKIISVIRNDFNFSEIHLVEITEFMAEHFGIQLDFSGILNSLVSSIIGISKNFLLALPNTILNFFIMFFFMYYLFKDGEIFVKNIEKYIPFSSEQKTLLINRIRKTTSAVLYGHIVTAIAQGIIAGIGYFIFGTIAPIFLGLLTTFFALFPVAGPPLIYVPISVYLFLTSLQASDYFGVARSIGLLIYGIGIVSTVDNIIKPKIISDQAQIHPLIIIIGVFGGLSLFGFIGFILGPLIFAVFFEILKAYQIE
ncbi:AI-2E family transporter [Candidatus Woesearchaeota archaeon]|nr:AI-2E family transporter [Candidatus Woesearchaeota archaeon]